MATEELDDSEYLASKGLQDSTPLVRSVRVRGLHGRSDYDLDLTVEDSVGRLSLFYGDNGSGKTTILRLLWDLLSPARDRNHRSRIAKVAFSEFGVSLSGNVSIVAERKLPVTGPYTISVRRGKRLVSRTNWPEQHHYEEFFAEWNVREIERRAAGEDDEIAAVAAHVLAKRRFFNELAKFGAPPFFLADDRTTSSDQLSSRRGNLDVRRLRAAPDDLEGAPSRRALADELDRSLDHVNGKLRRLALGGTVSGSAGANSVYVEVTSHLAEAQQWHENARIIRQDLVAQVREMGQRSKRFEALGLVPKFASGEYLRNIEQIPDGNIAVLRSILAPYLQSLTARLDALEEPQTLIQTLLDEANGFLSDKRLAYRNRTLRIELLDGTKLEADQLSSGECHVLLLLFSAVVARDNSRLFLIDEPELSLNVKWQRRIVRSLLSLTQGSGLQFLIATHSIELLSSYRSRVVKLRPQAGASA